MPWDRPGRGRTLSDVNGWRVCLALAGGLWLLLVLAGVGVLVVSTNWPAVLS